MTRRSSTRVWVAMATVAAGCSWACGDDNRVASPNTAGSGVMTDGGSDGLGGGGEAGRGALAGAGGVGAGATGTCIEHVSCDNWGASFGCPATLDDLGEFCRFSHMQRYHSSCGGTLVDATNGAQDSEWTFDAEGKLIGLISVGDLRDCDYWGTRCQPVGAPESLCGVGGEGGSDAIAGEGGLGGIAGEGGLSGAGGSR